MVKAHMGTGKAHFHSHEQAADKKESWCVLASHSCAFAVAHAWPRNAWHSAFRLNADEHGNVTFKGEARLLKLAHKALHNGGFTELVYATWDSTVSAPALSEAAVQGSSSSTI
eukprot:2666836-Prymnesium_polylepis.1